MTDDLTRPIETPPASEPFAPAEPATTPAGTEPVTTAGTPGPNRVRWVVGLGVAGLAVAVAIGAFIVLGSRPTPEALKYVPGDAAIVVEVRMDLPGDQLQKLGNLLGHFPGFADQSTLPAKIDESLSRLVQQGGKTEIDYVRDIKPWLSGPAFIAMRLPAATGSGATSTGSGATPAERAVVSATTTGTVTCDTPLKGKTVTKETYRGLELSIASSTAADASSGQVACVIDGRQALIGDVASVHDALDAKAAGTGMDKSADYGAARAALQGDQLSTIYLNGKAYASLVSGTAATTPGIGDLTALTGPVPDWAITGIRAEDDGLSPPPA